MKRLVVITFALTLFNSWVLFEELVIDRLGWWRWLPCYRKGMFCEWDVGAIVVIVIIAVIVYRRLRADA
jgi:hypothetical protein